MACLDVDGIIFLSFVVIVNLKDYVLLLKTVHLHGSFRFCFKNFT